MQRLAYVMTVLCVIVVPPAPAGAQDTAALPAAQGAIVGDVSGQQRAVPLPRMVPALQLAQQSTTGTTSAACTLTDGPSVAENSDYFWRMRAYSSLDCVTELIDRALSSSAGSATNRPVVAEDDQVLVSREMLDRIRTLVWWARDAAARVGR